MTAPVDVLSHLAGMALHYGEKWQAAHDAVAELIEVDRRICGRAYRKAGGGWWMVSSDEMTALRAALARVGGAQ